MRYMLLALMVIAGLFDTLFAARHDHMHFSSAFNSNRYFRVVTPAVYDGSGATRYPVIYYCNGCGGSYIGDSYSSYGDGGLVHPYCEVSCSTWMRKPFNADFQMAADSLKVLVVAVDGNIPAGGCNAYYPFGNYDDLVSWGGSDYNYSKYIRELIRVVDSLYPTNPAPGARALSGLSMGGHSALWIGSSNPHLFRSVSHFCHSPTHWSVGAPPNTTPVDVTQLWRNFRGVTTRSSANDQDYLYQYTQQMGVILEGSGDNDYHQAVFWRHWAADMDSQFMFHAATFKTAKTVPVSFSQINPYPAFDVWGYSVTSSKAQKGWIYLKDVNPSGLGIMTRYRLPYGKPLTPFTINVKTPPIYQANGAYRVVRYHYRIGVFSAGDATADGTGALSLTGAGGMGEEIGLAGNGLAPQVALLTDTLMENISIAAGRDTALAFDLVNLTESPLSNVIVTCTASNSDLHLSKASAVRASVPALSKVRIDSLVVIRGAYREFRNIGYLRFRFNAGGTSLTREQVVQVNVMGGLFELDSGEVEIFDGKTKSLEVMYNASSNAVGSYSISEGTGDRDGRPDSGETVSIWFRSARGYDTIMDNNTWHPTMPLNGMSNPDVTFMGNEFHNFNRGRAIWSCLVRINRTPTDANPIRIPLASEFLYTDPSPGSHKGIDSYTYRYRTLTLPLHKIAVETPAGRPSDRLYLRSKPNPFNPAVRIHFSAPSGWNPRLAIYSPAGKLIRSINLGSLAGRGFVDWNGCDDGGRKITGGLYIVRLTTGQMALSEKIAYLP